MDDDHDEAADYEMSDYDIRLRALRLALASYDYLGSCAVVTHARVLYDFLTANMNPLDDDA
jgi:hypothetical protein